MPRAVEEEAAAVMTRIGVIKFLVRDEDVLLLDPRAVANFSAHHARHRRAAVAPQLGVCEVEPAVLRVVGMRDEIEKAAILPHEGFWRVANRRRLQLAL